MKVSETSLFGAVCKIVYGGERSTVSVSLINDAEDAPGPVKFGVLAYSLPYKQKTVTSVLISSEDQNTVDSTTQVADMLAAMLLRPVFVNSAIRNMNPMLMNSIKEYVQEEIA